MLDSDVCGGAFRGTFLQGIVNPSMFFVSSGTFRRVVSDDAVAFREEVIRCRVQHLNLRAPKLQSPSGSLLNGTWMRSALDQSHAVRSHLFNVAVPAILCCWAGLLKAPFEIAVVCLYKKRCREINDWLVTVLRS